MRATRQPTPPGCRAALLLAALLAVATCPTPASAAEGAPRADRPLTYHNDVDPKIPESIHVVRLSRTHPEFRFATTLGQGRTLGMSTVAAQVRALAPALGQPVAAVNGDYYDKSKDYPGCPRDLQICEGELVSNPAGHNCFWIDSTGAPHLTNVFSRFRVVWPDGTETRTGLNRQRTNNEAMLYTAPIGPSTRTTGGREYVLEPAPGAAWLPLRAGQTCAARIRASREAGDTPVDPGTAILSLSPELAAGRAALAPGANLTLILETVPDVGGAAFAIGGGPTLVRDSKTPGTTGWVLMRHPHTALGWNKDYYFLVVVDGRQIDLSLGMTFPELASYMLKLGCEQAFALDGGGSATLWALGEVRNSPSEGQERPAPNALVVLKRPARAVRK